MNNNNPDLLSFKEFPPVHGSARSNNNYPTAQISINSPTKTTFSDSNNSKDPLEDLIKDMSYSVRVLDEQEKTGSMGQQQQLPIGDEETPKKTLSPINIEFYQQFFNIDTFMVLERIAASMVPKRAPPNYLKSNIGMNPDLYGPFWITVTLIFSIAISGNIANYLQSADESYHWHYNFHLVSYAATTIFIYAFFVPGALWAVFKWSLKPNESDLEAESAEYTPSLLSLMCIYGYSLAIYIPVSILWLIQYSVLQWILVLTGAFLSGSVLIFVLTPALRNSKFSLFIMIGIVTAHFLLAAGFMLYFFHEHGGVTTPQIAAAPAPVQQITQAAALTLNQTNVRI